MCRSKPEASTYCPTVALWLELAAQANGLAAPYLLGDANLDGAVDGQDFISWNSHKFTSSLSWDDGDFNGDGFVDGQDFVSWNLNKFSSANMIHVPAPDGWLVWVVLSGWLVIHHGLWQRA